MEFGPQALGYGLASHAEAFPSTGLTGDTSETQEIEGLRVALAQAASLGRIAEAEFDQARFVWGK